MNDALQQRILRRLEALSDEQGYRVLDYVEFLESKYGARAAEPGLITRLTETAEDTMRAAGVPLRRVVLHEIPTNECWTRDHGPAFLTRTRRGRTDACAACHLRARHRQQAPPVDSQMPMGPCAFRL